MKNLILLISVILLIGCSKPEETVKNLSFNECPDKTIQQVFSNNFNNQKWKSFKKDGKEYVRFDGVQKINKKLPVTFVFEKDEVDLWNVSALYVDGQDLMSGLFALMIPEVYEEMCSREESNNDKLNGQGTQTFSDGGKYVGEFKDGKRNGQGTETFSDGVKYVGEYKDGRFNGQGTYTFPDGGKYVGEFKDDKFNGQGTLTFPDGGQYVGEFKDGRFNGQGTKTSADGIVKKGLWKNNNFVQEE